MKKLILIYICLLGMATADSYGHGTGEWISGHSGVLYFRFDEALVDSGYANNGKTIEALGKLFSDKVLASRIDSVHIYAYASPEGARLYNEQLAYRRATAAKEYLTLNYPLINGDCIRLFPKGEAWDGLWKIIVWDTEIPEREELMMIMDQVKDTEKRKGLLKFLNGGRAYRYIEKNVLPRLRNAAICTVWMKPADPGSIVTGETPALPVTSRIITPLTAQIPGKHETKNNHIPRKPLLALKTNLLFDAALIPNVEVEVPIGKRFSVNGELMFPWWLFDDNRYCMQVLAGGIEGRYWLGNREKKYALTGHFMALYAGGGKYDLQWKDEGYQGEFFIAAGIGYGYAHKIARNLRLEYNLGIGLLRTGYRHYHMRSNYQTLLWQNNGNYTWLGPTKVKISLVWMLNRKVRKGGAR